MSAGLQLPLPAQFNNFKMSSPAELRRKEVRESHEPMVAIQKLAPAISCRPILKETNELLGTDLMFARTAVVRRLVAAERDFRVLVERRTDLFPSGSRFIVGYAYRLPEVQRDYFSRACQLVKREKPHLLTDDEVRNEAFRYVNFPELAGHPAGAALDVSVIDAQGKEIWMGTKFLSFDEKTDLAASALRDKDGTVHERRMLLRRAMMQAGFAPYQGEWWHFSYGDREWAAFYDKPFALYGQVPRNRVEAMISK